MWLYVFCVYDSNTAGKETDKASSLGTWKELAGAREVSLRLYTVLNFIDEAEKEQI